MDGKEQNWLLIKRSDADGSEWYAGQQTYRPMLASLAKSVPHGEGWTYEVKFDGFRALAYVRNSECKLLSRNEKELNGRFPEVAKALVKAVKSPNAVVDGEICRIDPAGRTSFSELQQGSGPLVFYAFDLLELDGEPLVDLPLTERKAQLRKLLDKRVTTVAFSEDFDDGDALFEVAQAQGLEGLIAKRADSTYKQGKRTRDWLKVKTENNEEFVVAGYTRGGGRRADTFGALVLAVNEGDELRYVGNVGTGFDDAEIDKLLRLLRPLHRDTPPFTVAPKMPRVRKGDVQWVEPQLVAQVRFGEWTHDDHLRHPAYLGIREDKSAGEVTREQPIADVIRLGKRELRLSNLDKPFWPDEGITKGDLLRYYQAIAPTVLPHLRQRPFTMRRLPRRRVRQGVLPEGRADAHARLDPAPPRARLDPRQGTHEEVGRLPGRRRRAGAALDGQHGLHRPEHVVLARRQARPARLLPLRPRPDAGGAVGADDRGGADPQGAARPARARRRSRRPPAARASTCSCRSTAARRSSSRARSPKSSPARSRARIRSSRRPNGRRRAGAAC